MTNIERDIRDFVQLKLRCRESLRARIEEQAEQHGCSLNAEAVRRLEQSFENETIIGALQREIADLRRTVEEVVRQAVKDGIGTLGVGRALTDEDIEAEKKLKERDAA